MGPTEKHEIRKETIALLGIYHSFTFVLGPCRVCREVYNTS